MRHSPAASARLITPNEKRPPCPELVSSSPTSDRAPPAHNWVSGKRSNVLTLESSGQRVVNAHTSRMSSARTPASVEQRPVGGNVLGGTVKLLEQPAGNDAVGDRGRVERGGCQHAANSVTRADASSPRSAGYWPPMTISWSSSRFIRQAATGP